jgi:P4 family phage/plasmid primase-like protien
MTISNIFNESADYWYYNIGVNTIPADTKNKRIMISWKEIQDKSIPIEIHESRKKLGHYNDGIAILTGKIWRGKYEGKYLIGIDCDNKIVINEICNSLSFKDINELANWTIVEQHKDNQEKAHIYILSTKPFKNKGRNVDKTKLGSLSEIPAIEIKCERQTMFTTPSIHKDGSPYEILGIKEPVLFDEFEQTLENIFRKYGMEDYVYHNNSNSKLPEPLRKLILLLEIPSVFEFKIHEGTRHTTMLSFANSLLFKYRYNNNINRDELKDFFYKVNNNICFPSPLPETEIKTIWRDALKLEEQTSKIKILNDDKDDTSNYNTQVIIPLEIGDKLLEKDIVQNFVFDLETNSIDCTLNSKYKPGTRVIVPINIKQWPDGRRKFKKECMEKGIEEEDISLLLESLDNNVDLIKTHYLENHRKNVIERAEASIEQRRQRFELIEDGTDFIMAKYRFLTIEESNDILFYDSNKGVYTFRGHVIIDKEIDKRYGYKLKTADITEIKNYVKRKTYVKLQDFDSNIDIINLKNGLYNWRTGEFLPHTPDYYSLNQKSFPYDPDARPKRFIKFLREVLYLQDIRTAVELIAYTFIRKNLFEHYFILIGKGANGKNVFIGILSNLHGLTNISNVALKSLAKERFALVDLVNKDVNVDTESTSINDISTLKKLTGIQPIRVEQKGQPAFNAEIFAKQIFNANELPTTSDNTDARFRREIIIHFPNQFEEGINADPDLLNKIIKNEEEMSGIFNLIVNSMRTIINRNKIHVNAATISARRTKAKLTQNPIKAFLDDALAKEPTSDDYETSEDMHDAFQRFCSHHQISGPGFDKFSEDLRIKHGLDKGRKKTKEGKKKTIWKGCKLVKWKNTDDPSQITLDDEDDEVGFQQQETPEEKYKREQEEMKKW